jgi:hypothetical protein
MKLIAQNTVKNNRKLNERMWQGDLGIHRNLIIFFEQSNSHLCDFNYSEVGWLQIEIASEF